MAAYCSFCFYLVLSLSFTYSFDDTKSSQGEVNAKKGKPMT